MITDLVAEHDDVVKRNWPSHIRLVARETMHNVCFSS